MIEKEQFWKYLKYIFAEHELPTNYQKLCWYDYFKDNDEKIFLAAIKNLKSKKTFGAPKISDLYECLQEVQRINKLTPKCLQVLPSDREALPERNLFRRAGEAFADAQTPEVGQCDSPEDLERRTKIREAQWKKNYTLKLTRLQADAKTHIATGKAPRQAVIEAVQANSDIQIPEIAFEKAGIPLPDLQGVLEMNGLVNNIIGE